MNTVQGWPVNMSYLTNTPSNTQTGSRYYNVVQLNSGAVSQIVSTVLALQTCRTTPLMTASQITLEASDPGQFVSIDSTLSAVKAKKGMRCRSAFRLKMRREFSRQYAVCPETRELDQSSECDVIAESVSHDCGGCDGGYQCNDHPVWCNRARWNHYDDAPTGCFHWVKNRLLCSIKRYWRVVGHLVGDLYRHHQPGYAAGDQLGPYGGNLYQQRRRHLQTAFPQSRTLWRYGENGQ